MSDNKLNSNSIILVDNTSNIENFNLQKQGNNIFTSKITGPVTLVDKTKETTLNIPISKQSANALFTFMNKFIFLKDILKTKLIFPRYCRENISYLKLNNLAEIAFPMKCFCDIFINKLYTHMNLYGKYGIALSKEWGLKNQIQPVQYINNSSFIINSIQDLYNHIQELHIEDDFISDKSKDIRYMENILYDRLRFIKPIYGDMYREGQLLKTLNFHDEHEWRYVLKTDDDNVYPYITEFNDLYSLSEDLTKNPDYGLKIDSDNIKYLIVKSKADRKDLINFIINDCSYDEMEKYILISKILVFDELEVDW